MPRADSSAGSCVVEQERLLALVDTQRRHIDELRKQLRDTLEIQKQQQLQLIKQSPARKGVRKLLERAAADNTALANRVEELRAQRNALCITKAALTAQVSELIRMAADDRTREDQHRLLLHQLHQLCRLIQQPHLQEPEQQMAAVVGHIKQLYRERQELSEKLEAATRSSNNSSSSGAKQHQQRAAAAAACCAAPPSSPTGLKLDQRATSRLIWTNSCSDLFAQQQERHRQLAAAAAGHSSSSTSSSTVVTDDTQAAQAPQEAPVAAADTSAACTDSFCTAQSHLLDMSYISPLRSTANTNSSSSSSKLKGPGEVATPCSKLPAVTPAGSAAAPTKAAAAGLAVVCTGSGPVSTPLSAQSLSAFSSAAAAGGGGGGSGRVTPSPRRRQALQLLSPLRHVGLTTTAFNGPAAGAAAAAAAAAASDHCEPEACGSSSNGSSSSRGLQCCPDLLTPEGLLQEPLLPGQGGPAADRRIAAAAARLSAVGTAGGGLPLMETPGRSSCAFGSGISVASSSKPGSAGLCLQPEFRLAAADSLWPSPAANRANMSLAAAAAAAACSTVSSHMLWLPEGEEEAAEYSESECSSSEVDLCPRALTDFDFLTGGAGSSSPRQAPLELPAAVGGASHCSTGPHGEGVPGDDGGVGGVKQRSHRRGVGSVVLGVGVSLAVAAAGGAAAWRHKQHEVLQLAALLQQGAAGAAVRTQQQLAGVLRRVQKSSRGHRSSTSQPAATL